MQKYTKSARYCTGRIKKYLFLGGNVDDILKNRGFSFRKTDKYLSV